MLKSTERDPADKVQYNRLWSVGSLAHSQGGAVAGSGTHWNCFAFASLVAELEIGQRYQDLSPCVSPSREKWQKTWLDL